MIPPKYSIYYFITLISSSLSTKLDFFLHPGCMQELHWVFNWAACLSVASGAKGRDSCPLAWLREHSQPCTVFIMSFPGKGSCLNMLMPRVSFEQDRYELWSLRAGSCGGGQKQWWNKQKSFVCLRVTGAWPKEERKNKRLPLSLRLDAGSTLLAFPVIYRK